MLELFIGLEAGFVGGGDDEDDGLEVGFEEFDEFVDVVLADFAACEIAVEAEGVFFLFVLVFEEYLSLDLGDAYLELFWGGDFFVLWNAVSYVLRRLPRY
jgi:hypothetical protein